MKKLTLTIIALMMLTSVSAQNTQKNDTLQFMTAYRQFAAFVEKQPTFTKTMADSLHVYQNDGRLAHCASGHTDEAVSPD